MIWILKQLVTISFNHFNWARWPLVLHFEVEHQQGLHTKYHCPLGRSALSHPGIWNTHPNEQHDIGNPLSSVSPHQFLTWTSHDPCSSRLTPTGLGNHANHLVHHQGLRGDGKVFTCLYELLNPTTGRRSETISAAVDFPQADIKSDQFPSWWQVSMDTCTQAFGGWHFANTKNTKAYDKTSPFGSLSLLCLELRLCAGVSLRRPSLTLTFLCWLVLPTLLVLVTVALHAGSRWWPDVPYREQVAKTEQWMRTPVVFVKSIMCEFDHLNC